ncbi:MAG: DUF1516 family protein [Bacillota bacterium]|nr:DUF1516 family protein [Bacillota bacterium]MDP4169941.1 DUF1516 family protein [Bacillota bacterium]
MTTTTHAHITTWLLAIILLFVALGLHKKGNLKGFKIIQMVMRVFYLLIIGTGIALIIGAVHLSLLYIVKMATGLWIIGIMEFILMKTSKNESTSVLWIQFVIAFLLVLYLGLKLPMGFHPFA